ncbi:MAG: hypothetical protein ABI561_10915, partial [Bradyrhizobium sp.]
GLGAVANGNLNTSTGQGAVANGNLNTASGRGAVVSGNLNSATGVGAIATGDSNTATGNAAIALGQGSSAIVAGTIALGQTANATAVNAIAVGTRSTASGFNSSAVGQNSTAAGSNATAIGTGATVAAAYDNSTALGASATVSASNQMVFGTSSQTYTAPGMNSELSRSRQEGLLGVVTSDTFGNLASDNGALYKQVAAIKAGVAVGMALSDPVLTGSQKFGVKLNSSTYSGVFGYGFSAAGVLASGILTQTDRLTLSGAGGWSQADVSGYGKSIAGGRVSAQYAW